MSQMRDLEEATECAKRSIVEKIVEWDAQNQAPNSLLVLSATYESIKGHLQSIKDELEGCLSSSKMVKIKVNNRVSSVCLAGECLVFRPQPEKERIVVIRSNKLGSTPRVVCRISVNDYGVALFDKKQFIVELIDGLIDKELLTSS